MDNDACQPASADKTSLQKRGAIDSLCAFNNTQNTDVKNQEDKAKTKTARAKASVYLKYTAKMSSCGRENTASFQPCLQSRTKYINNSNISAML